MKIALIVIAFILLVLLLWGSLCYIQGELEEMDLREMEEEDELFRNSHKETK